MRYRHACGNNGARAPYPHNSADDPAPAKTREQVVAQSITEIEAAVARATANGVPSSAQLGQEHVAALDVSVIDAETDQ